VPSIASAAPVQTFATSFVQASIPRGAQGRDAGVDVSAGHYVRVSASGSFVSRSGICGRSVGPSGCGSTNSPAATGTLLAAFTDTSGRLLTNWAAVGQYANLAVPLAAKRLTLRVNGLTGHELGAYRVIADVVPDASPAQLGSGAAANRSSMGIRTSSGVIAAQAPLVRIINASSSRSLAGSVSNGPAVGVIPGAQTTSRSNVQYALRRLGFSGPPSLISSVMASGVPAWVNAQLAAPAPGSDASIVQGSNVEALPVLTGNSTIDGNYGANIEDRLMQWQVNTSWQLREKLTLHWLEHFSVSEATVNSPGDMEHYIQTVRSDALGNYAKLVADVSKEPAVMLWLDNANNGYNPNVPPNENFGRELMQLYTIGLNVLNSDGSQVPDPNNPGQALATYQESDVKSMALALTGFQLQAAQAVGTYPAYVDNIVFNTKSHAPPTNGGFAVMGQTIPDGTNCPWNPTLYQQSGLNSSCVVDNAAQMLASQPTTWAYEAREMLERLVTETPSAAMIQRISTVWGQTVNDPQQIAKVVNAIANDPEFYNGKYSMVKEPIEFEVDAIRAAGGANSNPISSNVARPLSSAITDTSRMSQEIWDPPSVFSFYYPGNKEGLVNNAEALATWSSATDLANAARTTPCTNCTIFLDFTSFANATATNDLAGYLLDALVDGGTPQLNALVRNFLNNGPANVQGALWIILSSPEYAVN
jgi:uncharacterized protein (DUF1800 family)